MQVEKLRITPWKALFVENTSKKPKLRFLAKNNDFLLKISHCSGLPYCKQALTDTSELANKLNNKLKSDFMGKLSDIPKIHISGRDKNCGIPKNVAINIRDFKKDNPVTIVRGEHKELAHLLSVELQ